MTLTITKPQGFRVVELGCGEQRNPNADVAVDVRPLAGVIDFQQDLTAFPWAFKDEDFDCALASYVFEHLPFRVLPQAFKECLRILKPGGRVVMELPNVEAQIQWCKDHPEGWDGKDAFTAMSEVLYGSQDYEANAHKSYLTPSLVTRLLKAAGFESIKVHPHGERGTDMAVEAFKGASLLENNGHKKSSWLDERLTSAHPPMPDRCGLCKDCKSAVPEWCEGWGPIKDDWDYWHWTQNRKKIKEIDEVLANPLPPPNPQFGGPPPGTARPTIAEIDAHDRVAAMPPEEKYDKHYWNGGSKVGGYAREGYWDYPIHEVTFQHVMRRRPESVLEIGCARGYIVKRLQDAKVIAQGLEVSKHCYMTRAADGIQQWDLCKTPWPGSGPFDLCFSIAVMEHVPEQSLPAVIKEMARTCKRGLHGIDFGENDDGFDKTHCFPAGTIVSMADGSRLPIESLRVGDRTVAVDDLGRTCPTFVKRLYVRRSDELVQLTLDDGDTLAGTDGHPVLVRHRGWVKLRDIRPGDEVFREVFGYDGEADSLHQSELHEKGLQGDSGGSGFALGVRPVRGEVQIGNSSREMGPLCVDRKRTVDPSGTLSEDSQREIAAAIARTHVGVRPSHGQERGFAAVADDRVQGAGSPFADDSGGSGLYRRDSRRGRIGVSAESEEPSADSRGNGEGAPSQEEDARVYRQRSNGLQHRPQDGGFCPTEVRGDDVPTPLYRGATEEPFGSLRPQRQGVPSFADASGDQTLPDNQKGPGRSSSTLPATAIVEGEECVNRGRGALPVFRMAKVVSAERISRVGEEVFNIETTFQNYVADGVLVHNCTLRSIQWWKDRFAEYAPSWPVEVIDKEELERGEPPPDMFRDPQGKVKANIGCFRTMFHHGWVNVDVLDMAQFAGQYGYNFLRHDVKAGSLPWKTGQVDMIFCCHMLEHLTYAEGLDFLRECRRVLKPKTGALRIIVPDAELLIRLCHFDGLKRDNVFIGACHGPAEIEGMAYFDEINDDAAACKTPLAKTWNLLNNNHQSGYDEETLGYMLGQAGFKWCPAEFRKSKYTDGVLSLSEGERYPPTFKQMLAETTDMLPCLSLFMDAIPLVG